MAAEREEPKDLFSSRFALLLVALGMAIGTGNIWRFPRIIAKFDGGGTFLIPWVIFLFTWSIPLLIVEFSIGKKTRRGVVASLSSMLGPKLAWLGAFVALCTTMIMCYYAVIAGWCGIYVIESLRGAIGALGKEAATEHFKGLAQGAPALLATALVFGIAAFFVARGLRGGIERANKIFLPILFALLLVLLVVGLTREGAHRGIDYMFRVNGDALLTTKPWLEALSQSAFSTGAGWGLLMTFAIGSSTKENGVGNALITGVGNNTASLVAAMATIPAVFALAPLLNADAVQVLQTNTPGNTGMAMVWIPRLFGELGAAGPWLSAMFFLALTFAALTSLIAMVELATRCVMDLGLSRRRAIGFVCGVGFAAGIPSAMSLGFLDNQDWAWGLGLLISGLICVIAVWRVGCDTFRREWINRSGVGFQLGPWFNWVLMAAIPVQFAWLLGWWFYESVSGKWAAHWWDPLDTYSVGTCVAQWTLAFVVLRLLNRKLKPPVDQDS